MTGAPEEPAAEISSSIREDSLAAQLRKELREDMAQMREHRKKAMFLAVSVFWTSLLLFVLGSIIAFCLLAHSPQHWRAVYLMFPGAIAAFIAASAVRGTFRRDGESESHWHRILEDTKDS